MTNVKYSDNRPLGIGALAQMTDIHIETIRYYERIGILPEIPRSSGGHRQYDPDQIKRLNFVKRRCELGFSLEDIRQLISLVDGGDYTCAQVKSLTEPQRDVVRAKIADLKKMERVLTDMVAQCSGNKVPYCPIIDVLER